MTALALLFVIAVAIWVSYQIGHDRGYSVGARNVLDYYDIHRAADPSTGTPDKSAATTDGD